MFGELMIHIRKKIRLRLDSHHAPKKSISDKDLNTKGKTLKLKGKKKGKNIFWLQGRERLPHKDTKCKLYVKETFKLTSVIKRHCKECEKRSSDREQCIELTKDL